MMFKLIMRALPALLLTTTAAFAAEPVAEQTAPAQPAPKASTDASPAVDTSATPAADAACAAPDAGA